MEILKFEGSDFDPELDDELDSPEENSGGRVKRLFGYAVAGLFAVVGFTYTANIVINGDTSLEFGQGRASISQTACDAAISITPDYSFLNDANNPKWVLDSILVEGIDDDCVGKDFIIQVFDDSSDTPLSLTDDGGATLFSKARIYFLSTSSFQLVTTANAYLDLDMLLTPGEDDASDFLTNNGFQLSFDAQLVNSLATSSSINRFTIQSVNHDSTDTN